MKFSDIIDQASELLQRKGRLRYRSLRREFDLDDEALEDLRDELIQGQHVARDENGEVIIWMGEGAARLGPPEMSPAPQSPAS